MPHLWAALLLGLRIVGTVYVALTTRPRFYHNRDGFVFVLRGRWPWRL